MNNNIYITQLQKQSQRPTRPVGPRVIGPKPENPPEPLPATALLDTGEPPRGNTQPGNTQPSDTQPIDIFAVLGYANKIIGNLFRMISPQPSPSPVSSEPIPGIGNLALLGLATLALYTFLSPKKKKEEKD